MWRGENGSWVTDLNIFISSHSSKILFMLWSYNVLLVMSWNFQGREIWLVCLLFKIKPRFCHDGKLNIIIVVKNPVFHWLLVYNLLQLRWDGFPCSSDQFAQCVSLGITRRNSLVRPHQSRSICNQSTSTHAKTQKYLKMNLNWKEVVLLVVSHHILWELISLMYHFRFKEAPKPRITVIILQPSQHTGSLTWGVIRRISEVTELGTDSVWFKSTSIETP